MPDRDPDFKDLDISQFDPPEFEFETRHDIWQKLTRLTEVFIYILCLGGAMKVFMPQVEHQRKLIRQLEEIKSVEAAKQEKVAALRQKYELLKSDREYLETIARDRLNLAHEGEYIIRIDRNEVDVPGKNAEPSQ